MHARVTAAFQIDNFALRQRIRPYGETPAILTRKQEAASQIVHDQWAELAVAGLPKQCAFNARGCRQFARIFYSELHHQVWVDAGHETKRIWQQIDLDVRPNGDFVSISCNGDGFIGHVSLIGTGASRSYSSQRCGDCGPYRCMIVPVAFLVWGFVGTVWSFYHILHFNRRVRLASITLAVSLILVGFGTFFGLVAYSENVGISSVFRGISASRYCRAEHIWHFPPVISELKFRRVERQIFGADLVERAHDATLNRRPEAVKSRIIAYVYANQGYPPCGGPKGIRATDERQGAVVAAARP
jgi:hypothetical protein